MTDTDADALLRAIVSNPDDDTARLVYADWLQENGRPEQGEFIRTQCRLAAATPEDPEYPELLERDEELRLWLTAHAPESRPEFGGGLAAGGDESHWWVSHRGFSRFLSFDGDRHPGVRAVRPLAAALARAFERVPTRWLVLTFVSPEQLLALLKYPVLEGLRRLTIQFRPGAVEETSDAVRALAACPRLRNLRGLFLASRFEDAVCDALAAAPWGGLETFSGPCNDLSPAGFRVLGAAPWFRQLRVLSVGGQFPADVFEALCGLPPLPRLHTLTLAGSTAPPAAWEAFARSRAFPALADLKCEYNMMTEGRFEALAGATGFALRALSVTACGLSPGAAAALAAAPWAPALRVLKLTWTALPPGDLKALAVCRRLTALQQLDLSHNSLFGPAALAGLAANPALAGLRALRLAGYRGPGTLTAGHFDRFLAKLNLPDLRHLDLSGQPVGPTAARRLTGPKFAPLRRLGLRECRLTDAAVARLLAAPALQNLIELDLDDNRLKTGPAALGDPGTLPNLASCSLGSNKLPPALVRKLRKRPGVIGL
ncbi:TIGR02996 domain-containing protein [Gemmata sp. JC673]|uniref:TIGR02996 domain-containing protein n=1 Tax=Gemmata algarum TaxID=2975278 RepID=A0ABU5F5T0_9BACT|nr:TIGR02996 domain-containing protein [Gemmata algarum]MDY3562478.1 TIGR02996 domain-containing protein [Gemmata algarum]